ncbi:MAG TPA: ParA family protein [Caulobacteraceae bacterium]|nr:ParA family protein [Caulobacteraceae bacterium]
MRTIAVIARKGGSGKTTIAYHIAIAAERRGWKAVIADSDPQRSAIIARQARADLLGPEVTATAGAKLYPLQMSAVRDGAEVLLIDTPAALHEEIVNAVALCDFCLLIVRPTFLDLAAAVHTLQLVRPLRKPMLAVIKQAPPSRAGVEAPVVTKAFRALAAMQVAVAPPVIRSRQVYQTAMERGRSAEEMDDDIAAKEIADLWAFIERFGFKPRT